MYNNQSPSMISVVYRYTPIRYGLRVFMTTMLQLYFAELQRTFCQKCFCNSILPNYRSILVSDGCKTPIQFGKIELTQPIARFPGCS